MTAEDDRIDPAAARGIAVTALALLVLIWGLRAHDADLAGLLARLLGAR